MFLDVLVNVTLFVSVAIEEAGVQSVGACDCFPIRKTDAVFERSRAYRIILVVKRFTTVAGERPLAANL